jgi:hypothetical protein
MEAVPPSLRSDQSVAMIVCGPILSMRSFWRGGFNYLQESGFNAGDALGSLVISRGLSSCCSLLSAFPLVAFLPLQGAP